MYPNFVSSYLKLMLKRQLISHLTDGLLIRSILCRTIDQISEGQQVKENSDGKFF